ncbi:CDP-alcohol phosphatidyltransferase family protein [Inquilinus sp. Marseille-Q2685]|uniref:CDP-alcohol phosphatidyltransferase family protein n=1 Tax=Inquilinus sp. Marseille-Q2685 TaxID=2866581 RepID=UPI001CE3CDE1|nr:CDP-alcohol phosphatidyltransferase family protein [Inquilinus sp. Marseille-Q2685]
MRDETDFRGTLQRQARWPLAVGALALAALAVPLAVDPALGAAFVARAELLYGGIATLILAGLAAHAPHRRFGPANMVTLSRIVLICLLAALMGTAAPDEDCLWLIAGFAALALALDGVDGWAARRSGLTSRFGARFDMEADAFFVLVLSVLAWQWGKVGVWVLLIGAMRYLYVLAGAPWPWLRAPVPESFARKAVCVVQILALIACLAPPVPHALATTLAAGALALLVWSFGRDVAWLWRRRLPA